MCLEESLGNLHIYKLWGIPIVSTNMFVAKESFSMTWLALYNEA